jgi:heat shock protein HslJ
MKNFLTYSLVVTGLIATLFLIVCTVIYSRTQSSTPPVSSYKNATYIIDGNAVILEDGVSEVATLPDSASKIITRYFGNEVFRDLDGDGREDIVFLLTQETGGTGVFYYVVAALNTLEGYIGGTGVLLGDRIAPLATEMSQEIGRKDVIIVNYAERNIGEDFSVPPSLGKTLWLKLDPKTMQFGEVAQNFEGEADTSRMTLTMKTWTWVQTLSSNSKEVRPLKPNAFTLTLNEDKTFSATTDCNSVGGEYRTEGDTITFSKMMSTLMYCDGAQEALFTEMLSSSINYHFTSKGELILDLKSNADLMIFQ